MKKYDHPTAFQCWDGEEHEAIDRVLRSGNFTMGEECRLFENEFARYHDRCHGIMVNSGSSANLIAVAALFEAKRLYRGDRALVPALAWSTTYAPLIQHGLQMTLVDCDETWNAPARPMEDARLAVICSILGTPGYLQEWQDRAEEREGACILEDNCESLGAHTLARPCGTYGTLSTFSFFWSHQLSAIEGGMILTDDDELADWCRILRAHGWTRDIRDRAGSGFNRMGSGFDTEYNFVAFGYNVRPLEMHAAIARAQLPKLRGFCAARAANYAYFRHKVVRAGLPIILPELCGVPAPFGLHFVCASLFARSVLVTALRANGIDARPPTGGSFHFHKYGLPWGHQPTPMADEIHHRGLFLGNAPWPMEKKIDRVIDVMKGILLGARREEPTDAA